VPGIAPGYVLGSVAGIDGESVGNAGEMPGNAGEVTAGAVPGRAIGAVPG